MSSELNRAPRAALAAVAAAFLAANLATAGRSPVVWTDEVMFADPAVNLAAGRGFTTTAWFQPRGTFFAGNAPLYPLALTPWVAAFGAGVVAVRSLNYFLALAAAAVFGSALARAGLVRSPARRVLLVVLLLCGDGMAFSYRSGRYDPLGMLVVAGVVFAVTLPPGRGRLAALAALGAVVPWTGLQLIPYLGLLGLGWLAARGRPAVADLAALALGGAVGAAALVALFRSQGVWNEFVTSVRYLAGARLPLATPRRGALAAPLVEPSGLLLLAALALLAAADPARGRARWRAPAVVGLAVGLAVPVVLALTGKYVRYYAWTAYAPTAACLAAHLEMGRTGRPARAAALALALLACAVGLPARLAVTALEWAPRDYAPVERLVTGLVRPDDRVFSVFEAYYPARRSAAVVYLPPYAGFWAGPGVTRVAGPMTAAERDGVTVLITKPDSEADTLRYFGGHWSPVARYAADPSARFAPLARLGVGSRPYDLTVFRREGGRATTAP